MKIATVLFTSTLLALSIAGCNKPEPEPIACADSDACGEVDMVVAAGRCEREVGPGLEPRICEAGTGAECVELESFGTDHPCSSVTVACCPVDPPSACPEECDPGTADLGKADCDDGDPGTADRCVAAGCGSACSNEPAECDRLDPPSVSAAQCEDGDPCTGSRCPDNTCHQSPIGGRCLGTL